MISLDATIIHVGLPTIGRELGGDLSAIQWIANAYTLLFASSLLSGGVLSDRFGARRLFLIALVLFTAASAACGFAPDIRMLVAARAVQGVGAALVLPSSMALLVHAFADAKERQRALGVWSAISALAIIAGPVVGGAMVQSLGWRSIFLINLPVGAALFLTAAGSLGRPPRHQRRLDPVGQALAAMALISLTFAATEARALGLTSPWIMGAIALCVASATLFIVAQAKSNPILPAALLASPRFRTALLSAFLYNFAYYGALFVLSLSLQAHGETPARVGLLFLPMTLATAVAAFSLGRIAARIGPRPAIVASLALGCLGAGAVIVLGETIAGMTLGGLLIGIGGGALPPIVSVALSDAPASATGVAAASLNASRQSGGAIGVAVLGSLMAAAPSGSATGELMLIALAFAGGALASLHGLGRARDDPAARGR